MFHIFLPSYRWPDDPTEFRSGSWPNVRRRFLFDHPTCAACGGRLRLTAHHVLPVHLAPERELDPSNLIALCSSMSFGVNCHLFFGHLGRWSTFNPHVRKDSADWLRLHHMRLVR